jgi:hypothetical protein
MDIYYLSSEIQANECCVITLRICGIRFRIKTDMNINQPVCTTQLYSGSGIIFNIINLATWPQKCTHIAWPIRFYFSINKTNMLSLFTGS